MTPFICQVTQTLSKILGHHFRFQFQSVSVRQYLNMFVIFTVSNARAGNKCRQTMTVKGREVRLLFLKIIALNSVWRFLSTHHYPDDRLHHLNSDLYSLETEQLEWCWRVWRGGSSTPPNFYDFLLTMPTRGLQKLELGAAGQSQAATNK